MNRSQMQAELQAIRNLPTLPTVAMAVNRLLLDVDAPIERLIDLLEKDPALVMKILRLVNSSFYGFRSKIKSMRHAITLLGYNTVRNAVVSLAVMDTLTLQKALKGFDIEVFWRHAIEVAVASRHLAMRTQLAPAEDAFICGLLHDIGKVLLANFFPAELVRLFVHMQTNRQTFDRTEVELDCWPHSHVGSYLAQRWLLPETIYKTIKYHHAKPTGDRTPALVTIVNMGNRLAHMMNGDPYYRLDLDNRLPAVAAITSKALCNDGRWYSLVKQEIAEACDFFNKGQRHE